MFKKTVYVLLLAFISSLWPMHVYAAGNAGSSFSDVPEGHWAFSEIHELRDLGITNGIGNNMFGLGKTIKRSEFVTYLVRLLGWDIVTPSSGSFADNQNKAAWYYPYIETALRKGVISGDTLYFRPEEPITREEMAVMIVRALGYNALAGRLDYLDSPFKDVRNNVAYISIAEEFGIITGFPDNTFRPGATATREQAAAMIMRMYRKLKGKISELHAFYAISSSSQQDMIKWLDSVSFGWCRLEFDQAKKEPVLNTTNSNGNYFAIPPGFDGPVSLAGKNRVPAQLMVFADNETVIEINGKKVGLLEYILTNEQLGSRIAEMIVEQVKNTEKDGKKVSFDGVVIDFEGMKGNTLKKAFNKFLDELRLRLGEKNLYVTVHPVRRAGQMYYDGYDYRHIGEVADRVILMAHDYNAKKLTDLDMKNGYTFTPLTPVDEIFHALQAITDEKTGVPKEKIWLQISFDSAQWKVKDGQVQNQYPYTPDYQAIYNRLVKNVQVNFPETVQNPYATFYDDNNGTYNVLWYEDSRSVAAKITLAKMFGIKGISLWRLGNIPDYREASGKNVYLDVWNTILKER